MNHSNSCPEAGQTAKELISIQISTILCREERCRKKGLFLCFLYIPADQLKDWIDIRDTNNHGCVRHTHGYLKIDYTGVLGFVRVTLRYVAITHLADISTPGHC